LDIVNGIIANIQLGQINLRLIDIGNTLNTILGLTQFNIALGLANLGLSAIGFAVVISKLNQIDSRIQNLQASISEIKNKIDREIKNKIDRSIFAKTKSAIEVAEIALKMSSSSGRRRLVSEVIQPLLEAEHYYQAAWDSDWNEGNCILSREYILILSLVYVTETKCYLELEEYEMALKRLAEAEEILKPRIRKYVKLLFEDPSGYLHSACQGVRLSSILEILKYVTAESNVDKLFDEHVRTAIFNTCSIESWTDSILLRSRNAILALVAPSLFGVEWTL
jgi:tetratricopeptide (TPR) repeat protein